jgi:hypothetical protein
MNAKHPACKPPKKPQWQPENWLMLGEIIWRRLHWTIWSLSGLMLAVACLIHSAASGDSPSSVFREWLSLSRWFLAR